MLQGEQCVQARPKRKYQRYGGLVKAAAELSGRSISTVYAVLEGRVTSAIVSAAIEQVANELHIQLPEPSAE